MGRTRATTLDGCVLFVVGIFHKTAAVKRSSVLGVPQVLIIGSLVLEHDLIGILTRLVSMAAILDVSETCLKVPLLLNVR